ncbi:MAG: sulfite exporter TauE/SafE family protein, partial [Halioglobus sp.]|nr:sulfite exporter TauE/SafE family protein [Halioglobus sp.]
AVVGAVIGVRLEGVWFNRSLAVIMVIVMLIMQFDRGKREATQAHHPSRAQMIRGHWLMLAVGFWGGFIQIGIGFIIMPILNRAMGLDLITTNMHKVFIIAVYTMVALVIFASQVEILWVVGLALAAGNALGGYLGAHFTISGGERLVRLVLNVVLVAFITKLLFDI